MSYYRLLGLDREPFSTSPDPSFFYLSRVHRAALFRLRTAIELKRGLSLVAGDIGTGKTTLARRLSQILYDDPQVDFHPILNPMHHQEEEFLKTLLATFGLPVEEAAAGPVPCLHAIEKYLFQKGLEEGKKVVLLIDEAQQLSRGCIEVLRALLNYETNDFKLLQVILVGQMEMLARFQDPRNFWDRACLKFIIPPLDMRQTGEMIEYRLRQAVCSPMEGRLFSGIFGRSLFPSDAVRSIDQQTGGYPRRITMLCHDALEYLVMMDRHQVDGKVIREVTRQRESLLVCVQ